MKNNGLKVTDYFDVQRGKKYWIYHCVSILLVITMILMRRNAYAWILFILAAIGVEILVMIQTRKIEEQKKYLDDILESMDSAEFHRNNYMSSLSHELRTPLNTICGLSEVLLSEDLSEQTKEEIYNILVAGKRLRGVISDVMDFTDIQTGKTKVAEDVYRFGGLFHDVYHMAMALNREKNLELIFDLDSQMPSSMIGDHEKLRRIISTIVRIAIEETKEGYVYVSAKCRQEGYGANLTITVKDSGKPLTEEEKEKIFTIQQKEENEKGSPREDAGLGLIIAHAFTTMLHGFIHVNSKEGAGNEYVISIPQKIDDKRPICVVHNSQIMRVASYTDPKKYAKSNTISMIMQAYMNMAKSLKLELTRCQSMTDLQLGINKGWFTHIFISLDEYRANKSYFDSVSEKISIIVIMERFDTEILPKKYFPIYKPYTIFEIADALNGKHDEKREFVAMAQKKTQVAIGRKEVETGKEAKPIESEKSIIPNLLKGEKIDVRVKDELASGEQIQVLAVDDNKMNLRVLEKMLQRFHINVVKAYSGQESLDILENDTKFKLIFMDHMMPEMDGIEALHRIRNMSGNYYSTVPIVSLTANVKNGAREMFLREGFSDYIGKPIELSELERVLRKFGCIK